MHLARFAARSLFVCLAAAPAFADVFIDGKPGSYTSLQAAVDAAEDGDTLLLEPQDLYKTAHIVGKGLHLQGLPGASWQATVFGQIEVKDLPASSVVTISDMTIGWGNSLSAPLSEIDALWVRDCLGHVRVQRSSLVGACKRDFGQTFVTTGAGLRADSSPRVAVAHSILRGGNVGMQLSGYLGDSGGDGVVSTNSLVGLYDCEVIGGEGSHETHPGGPGGAGVRVSGWGLFLSGTTVRGGQGGGGDYIGCTLSGDGGPGLVATDGQVQRIESSIEGGPHGIFNTCGHGTDGPDTVLQNALLTDHAGLARSLAGPRAVDDASTLTVSVAGAPGDQVWILRGRAPAFQPTGGPLGVVLVPKPWVLPLAPMGVIPSAGTLDIDLWTADLVGPMPSVMLYAQALVVGAGGEVRLSGPLHVLVRNT